MDFNNFFQSKKIKIIFFAIGALIILLLVFAAGEFIGYRKARFSYKWADNYHQNFAGPKVGFFGNFKRGFGDRDYTNSHGTFGSIIKIDYSTSTNQALLIVIGEDNVEKTIFISDKATITSRRETIKASDFKVGDRVTIIGSPNEQGQIEAKLIRIFDQEFNGLPFRPVRPIPFF